MRPCPRDGSNRPEGERMLADQFRKAVGSALRKEIPAIRSVLYQAHQAGQVTWEEVEELETLLDLRAAIPEAETPKPRRSTKGKIFETRPMRCARMPRRSVPYRFVRSHGIEPVLDVFLSSGQVRTLQYLICRTGRGHSFTTLTSWLAADLGWHVRTIQLHLRALRLQDYIRVSDPDPKTHRITITLTTRCEVAPPHVRKKTGPQSQDLKGAATNRSSSTDDTRSLRKKGANPSAETGAAVETSAPAPASRGAPEHESCGLPPRASTPDANRDPAQEPRQQEASGEAEGTSGATAGPVLARRPAAGAVAARERREGAGRAQTPNSARRPPAGFPETSGEPRELPDIGLPPDAPESERRAAAADWARARIRGKV
jgi:hypothetical protein